MPAFIPGANTETHVEKDAHQTCSCLLKHSEKLQGMHLYHMLRELGTAGVCGREDLKPGVAAESTCFQLVCLGAEGARGAMQFS